MAQVPLRALALPATSNLESLLGPMASVECYPQVTKVGRAEALCLDLCRHPPDTANLCAGGSCACNWIILAPVGSV